MRAAIIGARAFQHLESFRIWAIWQNRKAAETFENLENVVGIARTDARRAEVVTPLLSKIKNALDRLPINKLSKWVKKPIQYETLSRNARADLSRIARQDDLRGALEDWIQ